MRCIVTGAAGFVGSRLAARLLDDGHEVIGIDCFVPYYPRTFKEKNLQPLQSNDKFSFVEKDLADIDITEEFGTVDCVFHQAAQAGVRASWGSYFDTYQRNNILATQKILESLRVAGAKTRVVYASSSSVYGNAEQFPTGEEVIPAPLSPYGVTKLAGEHLMRLYASEFGIHTVSLRYFTVYGPGQRPDMAFHRFCKAALTNDTIHLFGDGEQSRDFTYIDDIVEANVLASTKGEAGGIYNVGGGEVITINAVLSHLAELVGKELSISYEERQAGDARHTSADTSRVQRDFGYAPQVSVREGLERELRWVEENLELLQQSGITD